MYYIISEAVKTVAWAIGYLCMSAITFGAINQSSCLVLLRTASSDGIFFRWSADIRFTELWNCSSSVWWPSFNICKVHHSRDLVGRVKKSFHYVMECSLRRLNSLQCMLEFCRESKEALAVVCYVVASGPAQAFRLFEIVGFTIYLSGRDKTMTCLSTGHRKSFHKHVR